MKKTSKVAILSIILIVMGSLAAAEFARPDDAIGYRRAVMTIIGQHFGRIAAVIKGQSSYEQSKVEQDAMVIETMSKLPWEAVLTPGSQNGDTTVKPLVMDEKEDFLVMTQQFEDATKKLAEAAKSGGLDEVKAQFGRVAMNCKACHGTYRKK